MQTFHFDIEGMICGGCQVKLEHRLGRLRGVNHAEVTFNPGFATVVADPALISEVQLVSAINAAGYAARPRPAIPGAASPSSPGRPSQVG